MDGSAAALRAALSHVPLVNNAQVGLDPHAPQAERLQQAMSVGLEVLRAAEARIAPLVSEPADDGSKQPPCIISRLEAAAQTLVTRQRGDVAVDPEPADSLRTASDGVSVLSALLRNVSREAAGLDSLVAALAQLSGLQAQAQSMRAQLVGLQQAQAAADAAASSVHLDWLTHVVAASEVPTPAAGLPH